MKLKTSSRRERRKAQRALKDGKNPVAMQVLAAIKVLEDAVERYFDTLNKEHKLNAVPVSLIHLYTGKIVEDMKPARAKLDTDGARDFFDVCVEETQKTFAVFGGSCEEYCTKNVTQNVPREVMDSFFKELRELVLSS